MSIGDVVVAKVKDFLTSRTDAERHAEIAEQIAAAEAELSRLDSEW